MLSLVAALVLTTPEIPKDCQGPAARDVSALTTFAQSSGSLSVGLDSVATWCFDSGGTWTAGQTPVKGKPIAPSAEPTGDCRKAIISCEAARASIGDEQRTLLFDVLGELDKPFLGVKYKPRRSGLAERPSEVAECSSRDRSTLYNHAQARMDLARLASLAQNEYANYRTWLFSEGLKCAQALARGEKDYLQKRVAIDAPVQGGGQQQVPNNSNNSLSPRGGEGGGEGKTAQGAGTGKTATGTTGAGGGTGATASGTSGKTPTGSGATGTGATGTGTTASNTTGTGTTGSGTTGTGTTGTGTMAANTGSGSTGSGSTASGTTSSSTTGSGTTASGTTGSGTTGSGTTGSGTTGSGTTASGTTASGTTGSGTTASGTGTTGSANPLTPTLSPRGEGGRNIPLGGPTAEREKALGSSLLDKWRYFLAEQQKIEPDTDWVGGFLASRELRDCKCVTRPIPGEIVRRIENKDRVSQLEADDEKNTRCEVCLLDAFPKWKVRAQKQCALALELSEFELGVLQRSDDGNGLPPRCVDAANAKRGGKQPVGPTAAANGSTGTGATGTTGTTGTAGTTGTTGTTGGTRTVITANSTGTTGNTTDPNAPGFIITKNDNANGTFLKPEDYAPMIAREEGRVYVRVFTSAACYAEVLPGPVTARTGDLLPVPPSAKEITVRGSCGGFAEVYFGREEKPRVAESFARNQPLRLQFRQ